MPDKEESAFETFFGAVILIAIGYSIYWGLSDTKLGLFASAKHDIVRLIDNVDHKVHPKARASRNAERDAQDDEDATAGSIWNGFTPEEIAELQRFPDDAEVNSSQQQVPTPRAVPPVKQPLTWYNCNRCGTVLKSVKWPSAVGCIADNNNVHRWYELAAEGSDNYQCERCGIAITANRYPGTIGCASNEEIHRWNSL